MTAAATAMTGQLTVQVVGFASGLAVVRLLSVEEYAYYTVLYTCLGLLTVLTDSGIANSTLAQAGKHWDDRSAVNQVMASAFSLRSRMALGSLAIGAPACFLLMHNAGASLLTAALGTATLIPLFVYLLQCQIGEIPLRLLREVRLIQLLQVKAATYRLLATVIALTALPSAALALVAAGLAQWWQYRALFAALRVRGCMPSNPDERFTGEFVRTLKRSAPLALYYAFSSQLAQFLLSVFGEVADIAGLGAVSRYAMIYGVASVAFGHVATPWFSKSKATGGQLFRQYAFVLAVFAAVTLGTAALMMLASPLLLGLLGPNYAGMTTELSLMAVGAGVACLGGAAYGMAAARNVIAPIPLGIGSTLLVQVLCIVWMDINSAAGVLRLGIVVSVWGLLVHSLYFYYHCRLEQRDLEAT